MLRGSFGSNPWIKSTSKSKEEEDEEGEDEEEDEVVKTGNEDIVNQWLIDDAVKDLIEMGLKKIKQETDTDGFEEGS